MLEYLALLSKYPIAIGIMLYTFLAFLSVSVRENHRKVVYNLQCVLLFLIQLFGFFTLSVKSGRIEYVIFYGFVQVFLFSTMTFGGMIYERVNRLLLNNMCMLLGLSFMILSRLSTQRAVKQFAVAIISLGLALIVSFLLN